MNKILEKQQSLFWPLHIAVLIILTLLSTIIYSNSFEAPFVFDDLGNIVEVTSVQMTTIDYESLQRATFEGRLPRRWLPNLSFGLNYYFGGHDVWGYHLLNLVVHIMTAMVLYVLFFTTLTLPGLNFSPRRAAEISLISAAIWAVHPLQTNAVTYIVQRMTSMATLFYLSSLLFYIRGRLRNRLDAQRYTFWAASLLCGLLALVSKENSAMLPLIILAYEFYFLRNSKRQINYRKGIVSLGVSLLGIFAISWVYIGHSSLLAILDNFKYRDFTLVERLLTEARIIFHYLSLIVLPLPSRLNFDYDYVISRSLLSPPLTLVATLGIICLIWLTVYLFRRHRLLSFGLLWFLANLIIESTIIPLELVFEHRLYLPSSMLILTVVVLIYELWRRRQRALPLLWTVVIIVLCLFTWQRNMVWDSELSFWRDVVNKSPEKARGNDSLGSAYYHEGDLDRAIEYYKRAVFLNPSFYKSYDNLGRAYLGKGLIDQSIKAHGNAIKIKPSFSKAYFNLGGAYFNKGLIDESIKAFQKATEINPSFSRAYFNLGVAYSDKGLKDESIEVFQKAIRINPSYSKAYFKLGVASLDKGLTDEAIKAFQKVTRINPSDSKAYFMLGIAYYNRGLKDEAIKAFQKVIKIKPSFSRAYFNLGVAYSDRGLIDKSIEVFQKVIKIKPTYSKAYFKLGVAYLDKGLIDESIKAFQKVIKLQPSNSKAYFKLGIAYFDKGLIDESINAFQKAIKLQPSNAKAYFNLGVAYSARGLIDESIKAYQRAIKISPSYSKARAKLRSATLKRDSLKRRRKR